MRFAILIFETGDILFSEDFVTTMCSIKSAIEAGVIRERVLIVGKRLNHELKLDHIITDDVLSHTEKIITWAKTGKMKFSFCVTIIVVIIVIVIFLT